MKTLKKFEFKAKGKLGTYDWDKLLDGSIYQLEDKVDFNCSPETFIWLAGKQAMQRFLNLRANKVEGGVVIQAHAMTEDEKEVAAAKVAEFKQKLKEGAQRRKERLKAESNGETEEHQS